jgi:hypothetical protein
MTEEYQENISHMPKEYQNMVPKSVPTAEPEK